MICWPLPVKPTIESINQQAAERWLRFKAGDAVAFGQLSEQFYRTLYNYGTRFTTDTELIRDCIQDLFLDLWSRRQQLSETTFVKAYLLKAFRHKLIKVSLAAKRLQTEEHELEFLTYEAEPSAEQVIILNEHRQQQLDYLQRLISQLTKRQQEIIYLRFYQQLDHDQIAEVMNLSRQGVSNLLYRSLKELKDNWVGSSLPLLFMLGLLAID